MGKTCSEIYETLRAFVGRQKIFFVPTAPSGDGGHVNCSPKGLLAYRREKNAAGLDGLPALESQAPPRRPEHPQP